MSTPKPQFLILIHHPHAGPSPTQEELTRLMAHFGEWLDALAAKDMVLGANGLEPAGKILRGPRGSTAVTDGPFAEAKEIVGGYVLIQADNLDEALEAARACPGLDHRLTIEVRPVKCHHER